MEKVRFLRAQADSAIARRRQFLFAGSAVVADDLPDAGWLRRNPAHPSTTFFGIARRPPFSSCQSIVPVVLKATSILVVRRTMRPGRHSSP
jgi:hypothetical protein